MVKKLSSCWILAVLFVGCFTEIKSVSLDSDSNRQKQDVKQDVKQESKGKLLDSPKDSLPEKLVFDTAPAGLAQIEADKSNPTTPEKIKLGRKLFFDVRLSKDGTVSCATCHRPDSGFATNQKTAVGIDGRIGPRNAPTLLNRVYGKVFFWDGRAASLEEQALQPIISEKELGNDLATVMIYLQNSKEYVGLFKSAFAKQNSRSANVVTKENLAKALASFQRTLFKGNSPVDRFQSGGGGFELSKLEKQGLWIYESRGMCWKCHSGPNYSDESFHNTGVSFGNKDRDKGRFETTKKTEDLFKFKTPTLRGVADTAPYMHDGSVQSLRKVVEFYDGGGSQQDPALSDKLQPLNLSDEEKEALVAFLKALSR